VEPWIAPLSANDPEKAWDVLIGRYRRLIFGAIRRYTTDADDVMDVFARVCEALRENDFARLRKYAAHANPQRNFSTWLFAVVYNLTIDWIRSRDGRPRLSATAATLPPTRRRIFELVFIDQRSHVEAFEVLRASADTSLSFSEFLRELRATYREVGTTARGRLVQELTPEPPEPEPDTEPADPAVIHERRTVLAQTMQSLAEQDRLAVQMYIVDGVPAEQVARSLELGNAKAVYNRVYRALAQLRQRLEQAGIASGDL
jgi:RNA polymerase sigma factor (sigma-70 family)